MHILRNGRESCANLAHILCIREISTILCKSCTYIAHIAHWRNNYNLAQILCIGERRTILRKSCTYIAHWGKKYNIAQIVRIGRESCRNLAHILRNDTSNAQLAHNTISLLQNLICTAYDFLCLDPHCIAFQISFISASDLNGFPTFCKSYVIWMR